MNFMEIFLGIINLLFILYLAFGKSYFNERGRIVATKKDIDIITEKIEKVKTQFQISQSHRIDINSEKRISYINYYEKFFEWFNSIIHDSITNIDFHENINIYKMISVLNKNHKQLCLAEDKMILWNDNYDIENELIDLRVKIYENFHALKIETLLRLIELNIEKEKNINEKLSSGEYDKILNEINCLISEYGKNINDNYSNKLFLIKKFIKTSRNNLENIAT